METLIILALRKMKQFENARLRNVLIDVGGKYSRAKKTTFAELGAQAGDVLDWTVRIAGGAK